MPERMDDLAAKLGAEPPVAFFKHHAVGLSTFRFIGPNFSAAIQARAYRDAMIGRAVPRYGIPGRRLAWDRIIPGGRTALEAFDGTVDYVLRGVEWRFPLWSPTGPYDQEHES